MCDYSLKNVKSRPARVSDSLSTHLFGHGAGSTTGFRGSDDSASGNTATAICVLPGTELGFANKIQVKPGIVACQAEVGGEQRIINVPPKTPDLVATFVQVNKHQAYAYHDALRFADGSIVLLTDLEPGQEARVLTLPAAPKTPAEAAQQQRVIVDA